MTSEIGSFIERARQIADDRGLSWDVPYDPSTGKIPRPARWDLSAAAGHGAGQAALMTSFATLASGSDMLERLDGRSMPLVMGSDWIELYKAILLHDLFVKRNKPRNGLSNLGNPYRLLAGCAGVSGPSQVTPDRVQLSFNVALGASDSGQWARLLKGLIATWFDTFQLADIRPLAPYCVPFPDNAQSRSQADKLTTTLRRLFGVSAFGTDLGLRIMEGLGLVAVT